MSPGRRFKYLPSPCSLVPQVDYLVHVRLPGMVRRARLHWLALRLERTSPRWSDWGITK